MVSDCLIARVQKQYHMCLHNRIDHLSRDHSISPTVTQQVGTLAKVFLQDLDVVKREDPDHLGISLHMTVRPATKAVDGRRRDRVTCTAQGPVPRTDSDKFTE